MLGKYSHAEMLQRPMLKWLLFFLAIVLVVVILMVVFRFGYQDSRLSQDQTASQPLSSEQQDDSIALSDEQEAIIGERLQNDVSPALSSEQQSVIEERIKQDVPSESAPSDQQDVMTEERVKE